MDANENKLLVMAGYRLFQSGDIRSLLELYHDDAEWIGPESDIVPFAGRFHAKAGIAQFFTKLDTAVQAMQFVPQHVIAEGDKVVVSGVSTWRVRLTGRSYDTSWVHIFTMRDGKVATFEAYFDTAASERAFRPDFPAEAALGAHLHH